MEAIVTSWTWTFWFFGIIDGLLHAPTLVAILAVYGFYKGLTKASDNIALMVLLVRDPFQTVSSYFSQKNHYLRIASLESAIDDQLRKLRKSKIETWADDFWRGFVRVATEQTRTMDWPSFQRWLRERKLREKDPMEGEIAYIAGVKAMASGAEGLAGRFSCELLLVRALDRAELVLAGRDSKETMFGRIWNRFAG